MLPTISKIFERVIHMQFYAYIRENNLGLARPEVRGTTEPHGGAYPP